MKISLIIFALMLTSTTWGQSRLVTIGKAQTTGCGSPIVPGSGNKFTITCEGIPQALQSQIIDLLNKIAKNQANVDEMTAKINSCIEGVRQVQDQQLPWKLTDDQKRNLNELLKGVTRGQVTAEIYVLPSDNNSNLLGTDLLDVLQPIGWVSPIVGLHAGYGTGVPPLDMVGIKLITNHPNFPEAEALLSALNTVGIDATESVDAILVNDPNKILIEVGAKPPVALGH